MPSFVSLALQKTSYGTLSHNSWPWNSAFRVMFLDKRGIVTCQSIFSVRFTIGNKWKPTHAVHPLADCISLINLCLSLRFLVFAKDKCKVKRKFRFQNMAVLSFVCVCMCIEPHCWAQRGQWGSVMLLKSTTPICLSVRCLAWLSSTQWWCWQNDRRGAHSSECQFRCIAPFP